MSKGGKEGSKGPKLGEAFILDAEAVTLSLAPATRVPDLHLTQAGGHFWIFLSAWDLSSIPLVHVTAPRVAPDQCGGKGHSHLCQRYLVSSSIFPLFQIRDSLDCPGSSFPYTHHTMHTHTHTIPMHTHPNLCAHTHSTAMYTHAKLMNIHSPMHTHTPNHVHTHSTAKHTHTTHIHHR